MQEGPRSGPSSQTAVGRLSCPTEPLGTVLSVVVVLGEADRFLPKPSEPPDHEAGKDGAGHMRPDVHSPSGEDREVREVGVTHPETQVEDPIAGLRDVASVRRHQAYDHSGHETSECEDGELVHGSPPFSSSKTDLVAIP